MVKEGKLEAAREVFGRGGERFPDDRFFSGRLALDDAGLTRAVDEERHPERSVDTDIAPFLDASAVGPTDPRERASRLDFLIIFE